MEQSPLNMLNFNIQHAINNIYVVVFYEVKLKCKQDTNNSETHRIASFESWQIKGSKEN